MAGGGTALEFAVVGGGGGGARLHQSPSPTVDPEIGGASLAGRGGTSVVEGEGLLVQFSSLGTESEIQCVAGGWGLIGPGQRGGT